MCGMMFKDTFGTPFILWKFLRCGRMGCFLKTLISLNSCTLKPASDGIGSGVCGAFDLGDVAAQIALVKRLFGMAKASARSIL